MKAMILAAGTGTRLRPLTIARPKPMVPVANVPLLERTLRLVAAQGVKDVAVNLHHCAEVIRGQLGDGAGCGVSLHYSDEEELMGTAGGVKRMERFLDETFLVLYGDNLWQADFAPLVALHREKNALATIATFRAPDPTACGLVITDETGRVTRFQEKPPAHEVFTDTANAGVYVLEPEIFAHIPPDVAIDFARDIFPAVLASGRIYACPLNGYLQDTGTVAAYRQANWDVLSGATGDSPAAESGILIAPEARVDTSARLSGRNIVGSSSAVAAGARVRESILWEECRVEPEAALDNAILGRGVVVERGARVGSGAVLGDGVRVRRGGVVEGDARIAPGEIVA